MSGLSIIRNGEIRKRDLIERLFFRLVKLMIFGIVGRALKSFVLKMGERLRKCFLVNRLFYSMSNSFCHLVKLNSRP